MSHRGPVAFSILPERFADGRWRAILEGLKATGYQVRHDQRWRGAGLPDDCRAKSRRDLLVTWTRNKGPIEESCKRFETEGGRVIVAEEAHLPWITNGPHSDQQYFSLCLHDHQSHWRSYGGDRWASWNIEPKPWRRTGDKILVREQRSIGSARMASPPAWHLETAKALRRLTGRPVEIVTHPKTLKRQSRRVPSNDTLFAGAWCVVTWASRMGTEALLNGIPVIACAPAYFLSAVSGQSLNQIEEPPMPDCREQAFRRFAWAQWSMSEIRSGEAFARLLA